MRNLQRKRQHLLSRALRREPTDAEQKLWYALRGRNLLDYKFRRQHSIGAYVVDFYCAPKRLVIELDGGQHADKMKYDAKRTNFLKTKGCRVLRFWNNDVLQNLPGVVESIMAQVNKPLTPVLSPSKGKRENAGASV